MKYTFCIIAIIFGMSLNLHSQSGMSFNEFSAKLETYFDKQFIGDVRNNLPRGAEFAVWGWDVGDFSGDGYNDLAFGIRTKGDKQRRVDVYMFVDIEGYLTPVGKFTYTFVDLPLEIGVVIKKNVCYVTQKHKEFDWTIRGFTFDNGAMILLDEFRTQKMDKFTKENYTNYKTLRNSEKFLNTRSGNVEFEVNYTTIPSYPRGKLIYKGFEAEAYSADIDFVPKGAFDWFGEEDASFTMKSSYDERYLYFTIAVTDEVVVSKECDSCESDYIDIWIDTNPVTGSSRFAHIQNGQLIVNNKFESGVFRFSIFPGNFQDKKSYVEVSTTDELSKIQNISTQEIKASANLKEKGYIVKVKIPFAVLGLDGNIFDNNDLTIFPCTIVVNDIDNVYRPEQKTEIASSVFMYNNPTTYGSLVIVPPNKWYGKSINIFKDDILKFLAEYGY